MADSFGCLLFVSLDDAEMQIVLDCAQPLAPKDRPPTLARHPCELGPGLIHRAFLQALGARGAAPLFQSAQPQRRNRALVALMPAHRSACRCRARERCGRARWISVSKRLCGVVDGHRIKPPIGGLIGLANTAMGQRGDLGRRHGALRLVHLRRSGEVFATPILFPLAPLGLSVPDIPIGFRRRLTQAHSRPSSTYFFDFIDDFLRRP
jgi:hypothetical protein